MHVLTTTQEIDMGLQGKIPAGEYIVDDIMGGSCLTYCKAETATLNSLEMVRDHELLLHYQDVNWKCPYNFISVKEALEEGENLNNKSLLFVRPGSLGDLLFLTPSFRELKTRHPLCRIKVSCLPLYSKALEHNPDVDAFLPYPLSLENAREADYVTFLDGMIERHPDEKTTHAVDIAAQAIGLDYLQDKKMIYVVTPAEHVAITQQFPINPQRKRVGIQVKASARNRTYPEHLMGEVIKGLIDKGYEVFLFGFPGEIKSIRNMPSNLHNCSERGLTFRQSCALLQTCNAFIGPDSSLTHIAGILGISTVALFSAFPWTTRTAYAPSIKALTGSVPCAPCNFHKTTQRDFPKGMPCEQAGWCVGMMQIEPKRILAKLGEVL